MELEKLHKINCFGELPNPLYYCKETGKAYRQTKTGLREIKAISGSGYLHVGVNGKMIKVHVIVAMEFLGHKPDGTLKVVVDHINSDRSDNKIDNLQLTSQRANIVKGKRHINKTNGLPLNIAWHNQAQKFQVQFIFNSKAVNFGLYPTLEGAVLARDEIQTRIIENGESLEQFRSGLITAKRFILN